MNGVDLRNNLEAILININMFINIDSDRQRYAGHSDRVRDTIFEKLRIFQPFGYLFRGWQLGGSYGDNLKVGIPNEFDMVFHLKFPENNLIIVREDHNLPGNVHLDFTKVLQKISRERQHETTIRYLKTWVDDDSNYLRIEKLQAYFESCFTKVLRDMQFRITVDGKVSTLRYTREGPAHTIHVVGDSRRMIYSIDFVPGILLAESQSVLPTHVGNWEAIPKPPKNYQPNYTSFRSSFYRQEQKVLNNKLNLKNALRMVKKFRDSHKNMAKMKSYFIKTLFLWKASQESDSYWRKSLTEIIIDMFKAMEKSLRDQELPFFWNRDLNMYDNFQPRLLREMQNCVESARETLEKAALGVTPSLQKRVFGIFLDSNERTSLENAAIADNNDTTESEVKSPEDIRRDSEQETKSWCAIS